MSQKPALVEKTCKILCYCPFDSKIYIMVIVSFFIFIKPHGPGFYNRNLWWLRSRDFNTGGGYLAGTKYSAYCIYKEYHSVCPLVGIGTLQPRLSPASMPLPPEPKGAHSPAGEGLGESQFRRLENSLALCQLCACRPFFTEKNYSSR
jgi:hypothetical protein